MSKEDYPSDRSSPYELSTSSRVDDNLTFLDDNTLVYRHYGLRAIILGDSTASFSLPNKSMMKGEAAPAAQLNSTRIMSVRNESLAGSSRSKRSEEVKGKYSLTPEELKTYQQFSELLSNFEQEEMMEIVSDALRAAKEQSR